MTTATELEAAKLQSAIEERSIQEHFTKYITEDVKKKILLRRKARKKLLSAHPKFWTGDSLRPLQAMNNRDLVQLMRLRFRNEAADLAGAQQQSGIEGSSIREHFTKLITKEEAKKILLRQKAMKKLLSAHLEFALPNAYQRRTNLTRGHRRNVHEHKKSVCSFTEQNHPTSTAKPNHPQTERPELLLLMLSRTRAATIRSYYFLENDSYTCITAIPFNLYVSKA